MPESTRERIIIEQKRGELTQEQRVSFVLILTVGALSLIMGTLFIVRNVHKPFDLSYEGPLFLTSSQQRAVEIEEQKNKDTDGDGLTDYDELYVHQTSPYLKDTDGDGFFDDVELANGKDPNVSSTSADINITSDIDNGLVDTTGSLLGNSGFTVPTVDQIDSAATPIDPENITPAQLRQALLEQGATAEQVNAISDEELLNQYYQLLEEQKAAEGQLPVENEPDAEAE